jgi:hypothetical protein
MNHFLYAPSNLEQMLLSPDFRDALSDVAHYTISEGAEAAFVVYRDESPESFVVSDLAHGYERPEDGIGVAATSAVDFAPLIHDEQDEIRDDIIFALHSHPDTQSEPLPEGALASLESHEAFLARSGAFEHAHKRILCPSPEDLALYDLISRSNPGHIGSIMTSDNGLSLSGLLLFRHTSSRVPETNTLDEQFSRTNKAFVLDAMEANSYAVAEVDFDLQKRSFRTDAGDLALRFIR